MSHITKGNRLFCVLAPLFKLAEASLELLTPLIVLKIIDDGIVKNNIAAVKTNSLFLVLLSLCGLLLSVTAQYFSAKASVGITEKLRNTAFNKLQKLSFSKLGSIPASTIIARLTGDMEQIQSGINLTLRLLLRSPFVVIGACVMAGITDKNFFPLFLILLLILSLVTAGVMCLSIPVTNRVKKANDRVLSLARENVSAVQTIKAFCREGKSKNEFEKENNFLLLLQKRCGKITAVLNPATITLVNTGIIILLILSNRSIQCGNMSAGTVVALYNYMTQILTELIKLANLIITITKSIASGKRVAEFINTEENDADTDCKKQVASLNLLKFNNISFGYPGAGENIFDDLSFTVEKGKTLGIIGPTGCGKTTLVNIITGALRPLSGTVTDENDNQVTQAELKKAIAVAEQKSTLFSGTVRSNLTLAKEDAGDDELIWALEQSRALDFVMKKGNGLECGVLPGGSDYSGGQKQRLVIARALLKQSSGLVLDCATSALDSKTQSEVTDNIKALCKDKILIITSHRASDVMSADKIIVFDDNSLSIGTHKELLTSCSTYREIYSTQFDEEGNLK